MVRKDCIQVIQILEKWTVRNPLAVQNDPN